MAFWVALQYGPGNLIIVEDNEDGMLVGRELDLEERVAAGELIPLEVKNNDFCMPPNTSEELPLYYYDLLPFCGVLELLNMFNLALNSLTNFSHQIMTI